ncbi:MAG TPA: prephenate dehydratase [Acidimicrobiales bacterium]|jgi:prephenate dehydratase|nr:prephenate dehydratase [Acidimicrobiales bacterium]
MPSVPRVAFLGPPGTFTEEALLAQADLAEGDLVAMRSMPEVLAATAAGDVDLGFVALENSIEGSVLLVLDRLVFDYDLRIQREAVLTVHQNLIGPAGMTLADVKRVVSFPDAMAQCRRFFAESLPDAEIVAANSTAGAAREVAENRPPGTAAVGAALAAKLYGLDVIAPDIEDTPGANQTRFVLVARAGIPAPTGHDKTSIVCFQRDDRPGSLHAILGQFTARNINLTKLESRPTKHSLGDYCFIIDLEGHVDDEVVADCLRDLKVQLADVKFLGSYPAAGEHGPALRRDAEVAWKAADEWITALRSQVGR